ncbi:hypothetical protein [Methylobacterium pseudosasicola]|uniref:Uncharacterized protein n=1 Tax=Methylobacterium pseudosasicola TaxID=582667 RepID=A0A1I4RWX5_9HYPH|nr:hypothetical protein [Methylobacterium pseudosasicola]SFM56728.1 hypothetical protein SAMN05192568_103838 [Methylobacterium pseudosasicola]
MKRVLHSLAATLAAFAIALPSISAAVPASRVTERSDPGPDRSALIAERQQRTWQQLSGSICTGCITAANRVAPVNYDKPSLIELAQPAPGVKTATHRPRAEVRLAQLRKRYARLQRRDRRRLALRAHPVRLAKRLHLRKLAQLHRAPVAWPVGSSRVAYRLPEPPVERPWVPQDDDRWHAITILPASSQRPRRS